MAFTDILKHLDLTALTERQKKALRTRLEKHRVDLQSAITAVEEGLQQLAPPPPPAPEPEPPPAAKRRAPRRKGDG